MEGAFQIHGVDVETNTVIVEIERSMLAPMANLLQRVMPTGRSNVHRAVYSLGEKIRHAASALYGEVEPEEVGLSILDPEEEEEREPLSQTGS